MINIHQQGLLTNIANLMIDKTDTDFKITCKDQVFDVHKAIISQFSEPLKARCHGQGIEGQSGVMEHTEFGPEVVERMISYIYTLDYAVEGEDGLGAKIGDDENTNTDSVDVQYNINHILKAHVQVYGIADFYDIENLKYLAREKFTAAAEHGWQANGFINLISAVNTRSSQNDRGLRDALRNYATKHCVQMVEDSDLMTELSELEDVQDFAADMFRHVVGQLVKVKAEHEQSVKLMDREFANQKNAITRYEVRESELENIIAEVKEREEHGEEVIQNLITAIASLPDTCSNGRCSEEFNSNLSFERKGHPRYGRSEGDYQIRYGRCRARLVT